MKFIYKIGSFIVCINYTIIQKQPHQVILHFEFDLELSAHKKYINHSITIFEPQVPPI